MPNSFRFEERRTEDAVRLAEEISEDLKKINDDLADARRSAAAFQKVYFNLWSQNEIVANPVGNRLLIAIAASRSLKDLSIRTGALADWLSGSPHAKKAPAKSKTHVSSRYRTSTGDNELLRESAPLRTFLTL